MILDTSPVPQRPTDESPQTSLSPRHTKGTPSSERPSTMSPAQRVYSLFIIDGTWITDRSAQRTVTKSTARPQARSRLNLLTNIIVDFYYDRQKKKAAPKPAPLSEPPKTTPRSVGGPASTLDDMKHESWGAQHDVEVMT